MASWSENKILNRIVTHLNGLGSPYDVFTAHNKFGKERNLEKALQQVGHIYCFIAGEDYSPESNESQAGILSLEFWIVDEVIAVAKTKADYTSDLFRAYVNSDSWKDFDIPTDYPNQHFEIFKLVSVEPTIDIDTFKKITIFRGTIDFRARLAS